MQLISHLYRSLVVFLALLSCGASIADSTEPVTRVHVQFSSLPVGWVAREENMDPHWTSLGAKGINDYAFGAPLEGHTFAERSDPASRFYQAWFGVYSVKGHSEIFKSGNKEAQFSWLGKLAEFDQQSWLEAMGDPHPLAKWYSHSSFRTRRIAGVNATVFTARMHSHSDVSMPGSSSSELAKQVGMPDLGVGPTPVHSFHPITLKSMYAFWYDSSCDTTFVVYSVASEFSDEKGKHHDNEGSMQADFEQLLNNIRIVRPSKST